MQNLGIYIHIPFCLAKCKYCDFCSFPNCGKDVYQSYIASLNQEIVSYREKAKAYNVDTIYFGGGTPTILPTDLIVSVLNTIKNNFQVAENAEITLECNPATSSENALKMLKESGFNRLSIGLQSANDSELKWLGRAHNQEQFEQTYREARRAGFENVSVDVMFGIPMQTEKSWENTLSYVVALKPEHISAYGLILEEGTPFYERKDNLPLPDEETSRSMYFSMIEILKRHGYMQYEISNFAKENKESKHNLKYWNCQEYLGFGPAAYSCFEGKRYGHSRDLDAYLAKEKIDFIEENLDEKAKECEYVMLHLRLNKGVNKAEYFSYFHQEFDQKYGKKIKKYQDMKLMENDEFHIAFTPEGMYVSNTILSDILEF